MENINTIREDLAVLFRLMVQFNWHESVANHISVAVSEDGQQFLMNRKWMHFNEITADNLQLLDSNDSEIMNTPEAPDPSAWCIHGQIHKKHKNARVVLHCHAPYSTALACLKDPTLYPIDNNTCLFYEQIAYDYHFGGIANIQEEGERIANLIMDKKILLMSNHGVTIIEDTIANAFESMYYFERAAQTLLFAYQSGKELNILSHDLAKKTAQGWNTFRGMAKKHFLAQKKLLNN